MKLFARSESNSLSSKKMNFHFSSPFGEGVRQTDEVGVEVRLGIFKTTTIMKMKKIVSLIVMSCFVFAVIAQQKQIQGFAAPSLVPIPVAVQGVLQAQYSLNGEWNFKKENSNIQSTIKVPGEWEMQGFKINEGETAIYSRILNIPSDWRGKKIIIRFDGVSSHAVVKVNDKILAEHEGSFVPFEADITSAITDGQNILTVEVQSLTISDRLACTSQYAVHTVGGILRKVTMFVVPETNIADITINTTFDKQYKDAILAVKTTLANGANLSATSLQYTLKDAAGKTIMQKKAKATNAVVTDAIKIKQPQQWNPEQPALYTLQTELLQNEKPIQTVKQKIGFRQIEIVGNRFLVNGKPIKLHGVNRHSVHPLTGRSISPQLDVEDALLFRAGNCNYIRTSHYPPSEEFLNACDSLGLFVESESSLCWIEHGASPIWRLWNYKDEKYLPFMVQANMDKVVAEKNHPSIILWSLGNESRWSPLWERVNAIVKELDPTRPTSFHDQCWGGFNNANSKADIANYHYPGITGPAATDTMKRPTLFGEYAHLSDYNRLALASDPGMRSAYGAPLVKMYDSIYYHPGNLGGAIWSGIDDIFHMPDGRIVGYGPWGPIDAWRRPKPEYFGMKKAYSPVRIVNTNIETLAKGYVELTVENRYDFISLKQVGISVTINGKKQTIASDIAAHGKGVLKVPVPNDAYELNISFADPRGFVVEEDEISLLSDIAKVAEKNVELSYTKNNGAIFIKQGNVDYTISATTGVITSAWKNGKEFLKQGPVFCVVPMNNDDGGKPNVAGETYQNNIYPLKNYPLYTLFAKNISVQQNSGNITVGMDVVFVDAKGKMEYKFDNVGKFSASYEITYNGEDSLPYQYGLLMQLPKTFDKLAWHKSGPFSIYPSNDIARNEGEALLNAKKTTGIEEWGVVPTCDWKDDANELGSNDFRSTKHNIIHASLSDKDKSIVHVYADPGTQSSRAWLQDEAIQWLIADYCNAGSEPFYGSPFTDGRIKIKNKTLKGNLKIEIQ